MHDVIIAISVVVITGAVALAVEVSCTVRNAVQTLHQSRNLAIFEQKLAAVALLYYTSVSRTQLTFCDDYYLQHV